MLALARREFHQFRAAGRHFLYLVPSAAIFELNQVAAAVIGLVSEAPRPPNIARDSSGFGQILTAGNARILQFGLTLYF